MTKPLETQSLPPEERSKKRRPCTERAASLPSGRSEAASSTAAPAATARVMRLDTALRGRSAARSDSGEAVENRARYTFIASRRPTICHQHRASRAQRERGKRGQIGVKTCDEPGCEIDSFLEPVKTGFGSTTPN